jgi:pimeloyl-ACP methyl ester carboxylesterase
VAVFLLDGSAMILRSLTREPLELERRHTRVRGFRIRSLHAGAAGPPIVLLHGLAGSHRWWRYVIPQLARTHRVVVPELVGFGGSRPAPRQPDMREMAEIVNEWLLAQGLDRTDLVGHSMGGEIAIHLAASRPERIRRLVLVAAAGVPREISASAAARLATELARLRAWGRRTFVATIAADSLRAGPFTLYRTLRHLLADDVRPLLPLVIQPTLIVWGEHDPITPLRDAHTLRNALPRARLFVVAGASHNVMADRPDDFVRVVTDFLDEPDA